MKKYIIFVPILFVCVPVFAQENTVRTGSGSLSQTVSHLENMKVLYEQMISTVNGSLSSVESRIELAEKKLESLRREIRNIQSVTYRTEEVYFDIENAASYEDFQHFSDFGDGGGCG